MCGNGETPGYKVVNNHLINKRNASDCYSRSTYLSISYTQ